MNYLIDTHAVIWFITNDEKLSFNSRNIIQNNENKCFVSIASFWEIGIKSSIGRIELNSSLEKIFEIIETSGFEILPITTSHILKNAQLEFHHQDPFDRIMIAQAMIENLSIISIDNLFDKYKVPIVWQIFYPNNSKSNCLFRKSALATFIKTLSPN